MLPFQHKKTDISGIAEGHKKGNAVEKVTDSLRRRKLSTLSACSQPWSLSSFSKVKVKSTLEQATKAQRGS